MVAAIALFAVGVGAVVTHGGRRDPGVAAPLVAPAIGAAAHQGAVDGDVPVTQPTMPAVVAESPAPPAEASDPEPPAPAAPTAPASAPAAVSTTLTGCSGKGGTIIASGAVTNADSVAHSASVAVRFVDGAGRPVDETVVHVAPVGPGRTATWSAAAPDPGRARRAGGGCQVAAVTPR
jgi:hypothetical protein